MFAYLRSVLRARPVVLACILGALAATPARAADTACELHVWPSSGLNSVYHGWAHGGIVNGAVTGRDGYPPVSADPLATAAQLPLIREAAPETALGLAGYSVVVHPEALSSRAARTTPGRIAASQAGCYAELVVDDVVFRQDWVNGSFLTTMFRFRMFGPDSAPTRSFGTWVKTPIKLTPIKPPTDQAAADAEMRAAYRENFALFGAALQRPAKR